MAKDDGSSVGEARRRFRLPVWLAGLAGLLLIVTFFVVSVLEGQYALFIGVLTVGVSAYGIVRQQEGDRQDRLALERRERLARQEEARRDRKIEAYEQVIELWFGLLLGSDKEREQIMKNAKSRFGTQIKQIVPWGADDVLVAMSRMRETAASEVESEKNQIIPRFVDLLLAIRSDLGYENQGVDGYTIASTFITSLSREQWADLVQGKTSSVPESSNGEAALSVV